ncbi:Uncharacterized membrane protein [Kushneria avicenniae]|uniref:Uncharacterized membrane protein n=1 Tax=Kushneria avicenniae TaxID=402385 RepID=A0A1I1JIY5_9GAMM|nr:DUF2254 family protein [Kushneria avicenniae]SFC48514.1 Uncharacterized membrane protein [Kushneria avicenniae]
MNTSRILECINGFRNSIAYLTSIIITVYVVLGVAAVSLDVNNLPGVLDVLNFDQSGTAQTLLTTLMAGMISLLVFSFSTVMSVLTQAGSNFSNKLVFGIMTEKRHQQVLGHYLGTILYLLILLLVPTNGDTPDTWRSLAVYLGAGMVINSLAMFVFFIHGASQSVQINAITQGLLVSTQLSLDKLRKRQDRDEYTCQTGEVDLRAGHPVHSRDSGYIQAVNFNALAGIARRHDLTIHISFSFGDFVVKKFPILIIEAASPPDNRLVEQMLACLEYVEGESTRDHYVNGLTQLMEVAIKALSPGINDPGTARLCIHQTTELLCQRLMMTPPNAMVDDDGRCLMSWREEDIESLLFRVFDPILHYGGRDLSICLSLLKAFKTLSNFAGPDDRPVIQAHADRVIQLMADHFTASLEVAFIEARLAGGLHRLHIDSRLPERSASS